MYGAVATLKLFAVTRVLRRDRSGENDGDRKFCGYSSSAQEALDDGAELGVPSSWGRHSAADTVF